MAKGFKEFLKKESDRTEELHQFCKDIKNKYGPIIVRTTSNNSSSIIERKPLFPFIATNMPLVLRGTLRMNLPSFGPASIKFHVHKEDFTIILVYQTNVQWKGAGQLISFPLHHARIIYKNGAKEWIDV